MAFPALQQDGSRISFEHVARWLGRWLRPAATGGVPPKDDPVSGQPIAVVAAVAVEAPVMHAPVLPGANGAEVKAAPVAGPAETGGHATLSKKRPTARKTAAPAAKTRGKTVRATATKTRAAAQRTKASKGKPAAPKKAVGKARAPKRAARPAKARRSR